MNLPPTNVLVAARGHDLDALHNHELGEARWQLGESTVQRVETAVQYFNQNRTAFEDAYAAGTGGILVGSGGYATIATGNQIPPPPYEYREGRLVEKLLVGNGIPAAHVRAVTSPTTTLEVILRPLEDGHFDAIGAENPWAIITQNSQAARLLYLGQKATRLSQESIHIIEAPGEEGMAIAKDEAHLLKVTKVLYGPAHTFAGLRRAERIAGGISSIVSRIRPEANPAEKYLRQEP
jgi:hypothetical protein